MKPRFHTILCGCLLILGLLLAAGWFYWDTKAPPDAWVLDLSEQILSGISPDQEVSASFHLKNTSRRSLRILGGSAC
ncbi:MAG TPA: hypothetical protein VH643_36335 [Gemmataceae bacterium]